MAFPTLANRQGIAPPTLTGRDLLPPFLTTSPAGDWGRSLKAVSGAAVCEQIFKHKLGSTQISGLYLARLARGWPNCSSILFSSFLNDQQFFSSLNIKCLFLTVLSGWKKAEKAESSSVEKSASFPAMEFNLY